MGWCCQQACWHEVSGLRTRILDGQVPKSAARRSELERKAALLGAHCLRNIRTVLSVSYAGLRNLFFDRL